MALIGLGLVASLAALAQTPQTRPDWVFFRCNEERTGTNRSANGALVAEKRDLLMTPAVRWIFPHNMPEPASTSIPVPYNVGGGVGSPVAGPVTGAPSNFLVTYGTFSTVTLTDPVRSASVGTLWGMGGFDGGGADGYTPLWWFGYRQVPTDLASGSSTSWTVRENGFLQTVSQRIIESYTVSGKEDRTGQPMGAIRSTPALVRLTTPLTYTSTEVSYAGKKSTAQKTTSDLVVVGSDDGFIYCLDATPSNAISYQVADDDATKRAHKASIAPLVWRYDTLSLLPSGTNPQVVQVASSPVSATIGSDTEASIYVGTGIGYMLRLDTKGKVVWSHKTAPLTKTATAESPLGYAISASPAVFKDKVYFGAADSVFYCLNAASGKEIWHHVTGEGGADSAGNRTGLFSPAITGTAAVGENVGSQGDLVFVAASGVVDTSGTTETPRNSPGGGYAGALYALKASNGDVVWTFDRYKNPLATDPKADIYIGALKTSPAYGRFPIAATAPNTDGVCVKSEDGALYLVGASDGKMLWDVPYSATGEDLSLTEQFIGSPSVSSQGFIFITGRDGTIRAIFAGAKMALRKEDGTEDSTLRPVGDEVWLEQTGIMVNVPPTGRDTTYTQTLKPTPVFSSPAITRGCLFVAGNGYLFCYQDLDGSGAWGGPGYGYIAFDPNNPNAARPSQTQTPGSSVGSEDRVHVDMFDRTSYAGAAGPVGSDHGTSLGGKNAPSWTASKPGRVEWGDSIYVVAWNLNENSPTAILRLQGPNGTIEVTVPVRARADLGRAGHNGIAKYAFCLDPYSPRVVDPRNPSVTRTNPFYQSPLTPGGDGTPTWTVAVVQNAVTSDGKTDPNTTNASLEQDVRSRFRINNPLDLDTGTVHSLNEPSSQANGRSTTEGLGNVPVLRFSVGDHGTQSSPVTFAVIDRSHLSSIKHYAEAGTKDAPEGTLPANAVLPTLTVKFAPAELQWLGGSFAVYKPMFPSYETGAVAWSGSVTVPAAQVQEATQPAPIGSPNASLDYPNIKADQTVITRVRDGGDAIRRDAAVGDATGNRKDVFSYAVNVPRYQPANGDPDFPLGPGYATVNPGNVWTKNVLSGSAAYKPLYPQDNVYLTRVYVDSNQNTSAESNEAYRTFITGAKVRVDESLAVLDDTVDLPGSAAAGGSPPPGVPHGFVPFVDYWNTSAQGFIAAETPFYRPFTIVNTGNVNLWNVRMEKTSTYVSPLFSNTVDPNWVVSAGKGLQRFTGAIQPNNLFSTLDVPPNQSPEDPRFWTPIRKARVGSVDPNRINMLNPFPSASGVSPLPEISVGVPVGTPVGKYVTQPVFFEDGIFKGPTRERVKLTGANGLYDPQLRTPGGTVRPEAAAARKMKVAVEVMESRLTNYPPVAPIGPGSGGSNLLLLRNVDSAEVANQHSADPAAYRSADGSMHLIFTRGRPDLAQKDSTGAVIGEVPWLLTGSDLQYNTAVDPTKNNPWGWTYGNMGSSFFQPQESSKWWSNPEDPFPALGTVPGVDVYAAPSVISDGSQAWLFFQGTGTLFSPESGAITRSRLLYTLLDGSQPKGQALAVPGDETSPREYPRPFTYRDTKGATRIGVVWQGGAPGPLGLYVTTTDNAGDVTHWTPAARLATPSSLTAALQPSPSFRPTVVQGQSEVEVVFSGTNKSDRNSDLFLMRFDTADWHPVALTRSYLEPLSRAAGRSVYSGMGIDWLLQKDLMPEIHWLSADGTAKRNPSTGKGIELSVASVDDANRLVILHDADNTYTVTVDAASGTVTFATSDPRAALPRDQDRVLATYTPRAWRLTTDPRPDNQPIYFMDRSEEWISPQLTPWRLSTSVAENKPISIPRSRMWLLWRRGNSSIGGGGGSGAGGVGTLGSTTLFYKTYRLVVSLPYPINLNTSTRAPNVTVAGAKGPWSVDAQSGRLFFTEADEGSKIAVKYNSGKTYATIVNWQPETSSPANREVAVPIKMPINEGQVWAFKDPFSYQENLAPDSGSYLTTTNNNVWVFWSSTRGGVGDLYYMALSPRL